MKIPGPKLLQITVRDLGMVFIAPLYEKIKVSWVIYAAHSDFVRQNKQTSQ